MANVREVVLLSGVRTGIGKYGGSLKNSPPSDLAAAVTREAVQRAGVAPAEVGHVVFGNVIHTESRDMYMARVAAIGGGLPIETPALTLNRLCGSGLEAMVTASQMIMLGDVEVAVAGGAESMSRALYWAPGMRWGQRMGDGAFVDAMVATLSDPFEGIHMGVTAENVAKKFGVSRQDQDEFAVESHHRAAKAAAEGHFAGQIMPVELKSRKGSTFFATDEHVREDVTVEGLASLRPAFAKVDGTVTAGNSSGVNDAAAAVVLMERAAAEARGLTPLARLVAYSHAGVEPSLMGMGPVPAVRKVLDKAGMKIGDMDLVEANEAFAAQALAVMRELGLPEDKTNPNGGGIALGHPIAATGCILAVKAIHELARTDGQLALVTMCIGGGQGIAAIFERI